MEFIKDKIYKYNEIADIIFKNVLAGSYKTIGITGTSSVGKSTFSKQIKEQFERDGHRVQILMADDYLKEMFRGGTNFWNRLDSSYLKPEHFNWEQLKRDMEQLMGGKPIERECYVRGIGWGTEKTFEPSDYLIIEGLFLDSVQAWEFMTYDFLISLTAEDELVRELRTERDAYYRKTSKTFTRTESETQKEIENTLRAGKSYQICTDKCTYLQLRAKGAYNATVHIMNGCLKK